MKLKKNKNTKTKTKQKGVINVQNWTETTPPQRGERSQWGCATGWGCIFTTGLTIMGLHIFGVLR